MRISSHGSSARTDRRVRALKLAIGSRIHWPIPAPLSTLPAAFNIMANHGKKSESSTFGPKQIVLAFLAVLVIYLGFYHWIEYRRHVRGPWELIFASDDGGTPSLTIHQRGLRLEHRLEFTGETVAPTNLPVTVVVDRPGREVPFGRIIYEDLTFLPGVVTFDLFGHEVELLRRVLLVNKREIDWNAAGPVVLRAEDKPSVPPAPPAGGTRDQAGE